MTAPAIAEVREIALADLVPTTNNPREIRDDDPSLAELTESVRAAGVRVPVHARPHPDKKGKLELLVGARRHYAATAAGLATIPTIVQEMTDAEAFELTFLENYGRQDLTPVEQGRAVAILLARLGGDVDAVADRMGHGRKWVRQVERLQSLSARWLAAIANPKHGASALGIGHLVLIARLDPDVQEHILEDGSGDFWQGLSVAELDKWLNDRWLRLLDKASWDRDDPTLVPEAGPCSQCIRRSSRQAELFHDALPDAEADKHDRCLDAGCWCGKVAAGLKAKASALRKKHGNVALVYGEYRDGTGVATDDELQNAGLKGIKRDYSFRDAKKSDPGAIPALICTGAKAGTVRWVRPFDHGTGPPAAGKPALKQLRADLAVRRECMATETAMEAIRAADPPEPIVIAALAATFGTRLSCEAGDSRVGVDDWDFFASIRKSNDLGAIVTALWSDVVEAMEEGGCPWQAEKQWAWTLRACEVLGLDPALALAAATAAIPEPPEWAGLNADGTPKKSKPKATKKPTKKATKKKATTKKAAS